MSQSDHCLHDAHWRSASCALITVSDSRCEATDENGVFLRDVLARHGHRIHSYAVIPDDAAAIRELAAGLCLDPECNVVLVNGGTGIAPRDTTIEAVAPLIEKTLDGFGELFRMASFEQVGAAAWLSRALAGIRNKTLVVLMPGSPKAVRLAMQRLVLPQLSHAVSLLMK